MRILTQNPKWVGIGSKFAHLTAAHPCFGVKAHYKVARIHLPVAPRCNIQCNYCLRRINKCENRPGVSACIADVESAIRRLEAELKSSPNLKVVGIAGPGDSLENQATFETLSIIKKRWPELTICLSTNGLLAEDKAAQLADLGVKTVTITINAINPEVGSKIYDWVTYNGRVLRGREGAKLLINKQLRGIEALVNRGIVVKINTVLIPTLNMNEIPKIAKEAAKRGASIMNIIPLIPIHRFKGLRGPTCTELENARKAAERFIPQFRLCRQCRADACGIPGLEAKGVGTEYFHG
ncbi:MAG: radical SAM protein [Candidatus Methanomethylicaceae archaeon]